MVRHQRNESQGIRLIEEQVCDPKFSSNLKGKPSLNFLDPNRLTQVTRDTNAFASSQVDNLQTERAAGEEAPFSNRVSNSLFSESIVNSARENNDIAMEGDRSNFSSLNWKIKGSLPKAASIFETRPEHPSLLQPPQPQRPNI